MSRIQIDSDVLIQNISAIRAAAPWHAVQNGREWYATAHAQCAVIADTYALPIGNVADCLSVLSPQKAWVQNVTECAAFIRDYRAGMLPTDMRAGMTGTRRPFCTMSQRAKLTTILRDNIGLSGQKVESFRDNIVHHGASERVTVDSWAMRVARCDATDAGLVTTAQYPVVSHAYAHVARAYSERPYQTQAIAWVLYRALYATHHAVVNEILNDPGMHAIRQNAGAYVALIDSLRGA